ncbi:MAG: hypothetical protein AAF657_20640 [Acidobacteriota bacterium]
MPKTLNRQTALTTALTILLALFASPKLEADPPDPEGETKVSGEVVLHRKNTLGGWEIFASLAQQGDDVWIGLRVNDLGNFKTKILAVEKIRFTIGGNSFEVACEQGASEARRIRGIGILGDDTSRHVCPLEADQVSHFEAAAEIRSTVTVAGKTTKERQWKDKGRARWAKFFR